MKSSRNAWLTGSLMIGGMLLAIFALLAIAGSAPAQAAPAAGVSGHHDETPEASETADDHGGRGTRTPEASETADDHGDHTRTPEAEDTRHAERTETPEVEATESPEVEGTETPEVEATETPEAEGTPKGEHTRTPEASETAEPSRTPGEGGGNSGDHRPLRLNPGVRVERLNAGDSGDFTFSLRNNTGAVADVNLDAASEGGWTASVAPASVSLNPGEHVDVTVSVSVPAAPSEQLDLVIVTADDGTHVAHAGLVLVLRQQHFSDLGTDHWANDSVQFLAANNVISGYADGSFRPNNTVTRAQFAKMLVTGMQWQINSPLTPTFRDVAPNFWAYGYIETAVAHGVLSGYSDGTFRPSTEITRAQLAKLIVAARNWSLLDPSAAHFSDVAGANWAYGYVETAVDAGVLSGYADGTFRPNSPATRAQVAKILANGLVADGGQ